MIISRCVLLKLLLIGIKKDIHISKSIILHQLPVRGKKLRLFGRSGVLFCFITEAVLVAAIKLAKVGVNDNLHCRIQLFLDRWRTDQILS